LHSPAARRVLRAEALLREGVPDLCGGPRLACSGADGDPPREAAPRRRRRCADAAEEFVEGMRSGKVRTKSGHLAALPERDRALWVTALFAKGVIHVEGGSGSPPTLRRSSTARSSARRTSGGSGGRYLEKTLDPSSGMRTSSVQSATGPVRFLSRLSRSTLRRFSVRPAEGARLDPTLELGDRDQDRLGVAADDAEAPA
jgi:hypothetical protein